MVGGDHGSLTKEPPLAKLDATIRAITPGMPYRDLLAYVREDAGATTDDDAPGLLRQRYLLINSDETIAYDHFLSLAAAHGLESPLVRKVMYFVWAYRDDRIRRFVCETIADATDKWRVSELTNKSNSKFFEEFVSASTAVKARSNFEFFMSETGIFDRAAEAVHLELDDGWLNEAAVVAAQHETDPVLREELLANPVAFLEQRGWLGLLNAKDDELPDASPMLLSDAIPLQDEEISASPAATAPSKDWDRKSPSSSGKTSTVANIDLVSRERANQSHFELEKLLADLTAARSLKPKSNTNIDMFFDLGEETILVEIKSCTDSNFHSQLRKGVSQLFEYRFLYKAQLQTKSDPAFADGGHSSESQAVVNCLCRIPRCRACLERPGFRWTGFELQASGGAHGHRVASQAMRPIIGCPPS